LGLILERATHRPVTQYLQEKIWQPLGVEYSASWSLDSRQSGFEKMAMGFKARAIDFAKFGALFLDQGHWNGKQIVPETWVNESTSPAANDNRRWRRAAAWKQAHGYYKYLWWGRVRPDGSYAFMARGNLQQQWIYVSPRDRVVIVRFGLVDNAADSWPTPSKQLPTICPDGAVRPGRGRSTLIKRDFRSWHVRCRPTLRTS
jgi:CubicO group peptidase (beta-lactamase class C family)